MRAKTQTNSFPLKSFLVGRVLFGVVLLAATRTLLAQSMLTADKKADISVFAGYQYMNPDIGRSTDRGNGATFGGDFTRYFNKWPVAPALEVRGNYATAPFANESSILFGLRVTSELRRRFHPYADFLVGAGKINFNQPPSPTFTYDASVVYSYGGGVDFDMPRNFGAKVDFQAQSWNMGLEPEFTSTPTQNFTLAPILLTVGVNYHIPFRSRVHQGTIPHY